MNIYGRLFVVISERARGKERTLNNEEDGSMLHIYK
jgi:hypothetical protein